MNPVSVDIRDWLVAELGYVFATNLFIGIAPENVVDDIVSIRDTGGWEAESPLNYVYERPTCQIEVRDVDYLIGYNRARAIYEMLVTKFNIVIANGTRYIGIWREGDINAIGQDEKRRFLFTVNFRIHRTQ